MHLTNFSLSKLLSGYHFLCSRSLLNPLNQTNHFLGSASVMVSNSTLIHPVVEVFHFLMCQQKLTYLLTFPSRNIFSSHGCQGTSSHWVHLLRVLCKILFIFLTSEHQCDMLSPWIFFLFLDDFL